MRAILKSKHLKFCDWTRYVKEKQHIRDYSLDKLEEEIRYAFMAYQQKIDELQQLVHQYDEIKQKIRRNIKINMKYKVNTSNTPVEY